MSSELIALRVSPDSRKSRHHPIGHITRTATTTRLDLSCWQKLRLSESARIKIGLEDPTSEDQIYLPKGNVFNMTAGFLEGNGTRTTAADNQRPFAFRRKIDVNYVKKKLLLLNNT